MAAVSLIRYENGEPLERETIPLIERLMYSETVLVKKVLGIGMKEFGEAETSGDPEVMGFLIWLGLRKTLGMACPRFADLEFDMSSLERVEDADDGPAEDEVPSPVE